MKMELASKKPSKLFRTNSFGDNIELTHAIHDGNSSISTLDTATTSTMTNDKINIFIVFVFILELLVLVFVSVLEYFLRATDVFPVRELNFSCLDTSIKYKKGDLTYDDFAYNADISYEVVIGLSFTIPPFIIVLSELALWAFSDERQKTIRALCMQCKIPQVVRRIIRYLGSFIFGILVTMIFTDVAKIFTGRLRPTFLETCQYNETMCRQGGENQLFSSDQICIEKNEDKLREARLSFPSLHTSVTAFAAFFVAIYLHNVIRNPGVRVMRPFLALSIIILSLMCGLARIGLYYSHWTDVLAGFLLGFFVAAYICFFVLNNFREHLDGQELYTLLKSYLVQHRLIELRDLYKEDRLEHEYFGGIASSGLPTTAHHHYTPSASHPPEFYSNGMVIPRPHVHSNNTTAMHVNESSTDIIEIRPRVPDRNLNAKHQQPQLNYHNTFQRDLNRAVDNYRSARDIYPQPGHM